MGIQGLAEFIDGGKVVVLFGMEECQQQAVGGRVSLIDLLLKEVLQRFGRRLIEPGVVEAIEQVSRLGTLLQSLMVFLPGSFLLQRPIRRRKGNSPTRRWQAWIGIRQLLCESSILLSISQR